jgi:multiple sugar transport system permease protein/raffinose/stachyose/melibiose transport system permease protein
MRGQSVIRVLIFVPYVIAEVVVGTGWSLMLPANGAAQRAARERRAAGLTQDWLSDPEHRDLDPDGIITWKYVGFAVILFLAGLQGIPRSSTRRPRSTARRTGRSSGASRCRCSADAAHLGVPVDHRALQLFDLVYIIWGQYIALDGRHLDDGDLHGRQRPQRRQLRLRQRRRRRASSSSRSSSP